MEPVDAEQPQPDHCRRNIDQCVDRPELMQVRRPSFASVGSRFGLGQHVENLPDRTPVRFLQRRIIDRAVKINSGQDKLKKMKNAN